MHSRPLLPVLLLAVVLAPAVSPSLRAAPNPAAAPAAVINLFNGHDLAGWEYVTLGHATLADVCRVLPGGILAVAGKPIGWLAAPGTYRNYRLHVEWRWTAKPGNSGVLVHISSGPKDRVWPLCLQIQTKTQRAGDLLPMAGFTFAEPLSTPPRARTPQLDRRQPASEKRAGEWNSCDIVCRDGAVECSINGVRQNRVTHCVPDSGRIGLQLEGAPYEARNLRLEPLAP